MIALVDCNSFYASCEQVFRPDLRNKPVVVLSNNDGCIVAANKEAKTIKQLSMFAPAFKHKNTFKKHSVAVFSSNYALYADMSRRVMNIISTFSPQIEVYSIDEAFLGLNSFNNLNEYGQKIRTTILQYTGLPTGVGIAATKTLAKAANKIAKTFPEKTNFVHVIDSEEKRIKALKWLKVGDIWGIGRQHRTKLNRVGVYTAYDFCQLDDTWVQNKLTIVGLRLKHELQGIPCLELEQVRPKKKAIGTAKSFGTNIKDYKLISEALAYYVAEVAEKLRQQGSYARIMTVFIHTNQFRVQDQQYAKNITVKLAQASNSTLVLTHLALKALKTIFLPGYNYKKVGILLSELVNIDEIQMDLFTKQATVTKHTTLMRTLDQINLRYGKGTLLSAACGIRRNKWKLRQQQKSPCYTTDWQQLLRLS